MAIKNTNLGGTDLVNGDDIDADNWNDTFNATFSTAAQKIGYMAAGYLVAFSELIWSAHQKRTTDGGETWAADVVLRNTRAQARDDEVTAVMCDNGGGNEEFTTDAGANWAAANAGMANVTAVHIIDMPTSSVAVAGGSSGAGVPIWHTADGGDNWVQAVVGPATGCTHLSMFDASNGVARCNNLGVQRIWHTTNGGANWTDSGQAAKTGAVYCINAARDYLNCNTQSSSFASYRGTIAAGAEAEPTVNIACDSDYLQQVYCGERAYTLLGNGKLVMPLVLFMNVEATNHYQYLSLFAMSPDDGDTWRLTPLFPSGTAVSQNYDHPNNAFAIGDDKLARAQWNGSSPVYVRQF